MQPYNFAGKGKVRKIFDGEVLAKTSAHHQQLSFKHFVKPLTILNSKVIISSKFLSGCDMD